MPVLESTFLEVTDTLAGRPFLVGGKSMGGRVAATIADRAGARGVVCFGYPFHPTGKPTSLRLAPLEALEVPACIVQGSRDAFGSREEIATYRLPKHVEVHFVEDGDHSLVPRKNTGRSADDALAEAIAHVAAFARRTLAPVGRKK